MVSPVESEARDGVTRPLHGPGVSLSELGGYNTQRSAMARTDELPIGRGLSRRRVGQIAMKAVAAVTPLSRVARSADATEPIAGPDSAPTTA